MKKIITRQPAADVTWEVDGLHPLLKNIYLSRGVKSNKELDLSLKHLLPYEQLSGIKEAVACLNTALEKQERILIVGDFDADGATSTVLAMKALRAFGFLNLSYLVPNRFEYGYGLTPEIVTVASRQSPDLIITVDNGISSIQGVVAARELGIKVLITDHHLQGTDIPDAVAIVNPNKKDDPFPSKNLAGVGVIFYVLLALRSALREKNWFQEQNIAEPNMAELLDLVALGTIADVVSLDHNNRILVQQGLMRIRAGKCCPGIKELLQVAKRNHKRVTANDLGFVLGPRLNAAGRLDDMSLGIECLLADDKNTAYEKAQQLNELNDERRAIEVEMREQAGKDIAALKLEKDLPNGICLFDENWHQGVVGILASRIKDRYHRPVIAFAKVDDNEIKGSARSIPNLHIRNTLEAIATNNPGLINKFGGHAMAAGLSLGHDKYKEFCAAFIKEIDKELSSEDFQQKTYVDGELNQEHFSLQTAELLRYAGPWGHNFPEPTFCGTFTIAEQYLVGQKHLKLTLNIPGYEQALNAIAFNVDTTDWPNYHCEKIHAAYRLDINEYRGRRNLQLIIEDFSTI